MNQQEHLQKIKDKCQQIISLGEKRTQGEWGPASSLVTRRPIVIKRENKLSVAVSYQGSEDDVSFIAACAGQAEAMARSTIAAIDGLMADMQWWDVNRSDQLKLESIISAWPEELFS